MEHFYRVEREAHTLNLVIATLREAMANNHLEAPNVIVDLSRPAVYYLLAMVAVGRENAPENPVDDVVSFERKQRRVEEPSGYVFRVTNKLKASLEEPLTLL
jgi:hypothetical protein